MSSRGVALLGDRMSENLEQTIENLKVALVVRPNDALKRSYLGTAYRNLGRLPEALVEYRKALAIDPKLADAWFGSGLTHSMLGDWEAAAENCRHAVEIHRDHADAQLKLAESSEKLARHADAGKAYLEYARLNPGHFVALRRRGYCRSWSRGSSTSRSRRSNKPTRSRRTIPTWCTRWGSPASVWGGTPMPCGRCGALAALDPGRLGVCSIPLGSRSKRCAFSTKPRRPTTKPREREPDHPETRAALAEVAMKLQHWQQAADAWDAAVKLRPDEAGWLDKFGFSAQQAGTHDRAAVALERSVHLKDDAAVRARWGESLNVLGRYSEALDVLQRATRARSEIARIVDSARHHIRAARAPPRCHRRPDRSDPPAG